MFQFPSNGKVHGKTEWMACAGWKEEGFNSLQTGRYMESSRWRYNCHHPLSCVSIPFKREGTWKVVFDTFVNVYPAIGFNSLQTGRYMERISYHSRGNTHTIGFNSLQTGRYMERIWNLSVLIAAISFNSLQTGRYMESRQLLPARMGA